MRLCRGSPRGRLTTTARPDMPLTDDDNDPVPELPAKPGEGAVGSPPAGAPATTAPAASSSPDLYIPSRPSAAVSEPAAEGSGGLPSLPGFGFDTPPKPSP